jgi:hypothetical protein
MLHLIALFALNVSPDLDQAPAQVPARASRAAFSKAVQSLHEDWTESQVESVLGPPDVVWKPGDPKHGTRSEETVWCYGTTSTDDRPTWGRVSFQKGKLNYFVPSQGEPPSTSVISEPELNGALKAMMTSHELVAIRYAGEDPLRLIRVANLLIPKNLDKTVAILREYNRIQDEGVGQWMFWLTRLIFQPSKSVWQFPDPMIFARGPELRNGMGRWGTYPVYFIDDIPLVLALPIGGGGFPEPFSSYLDRIFPKVKMRTSLFVPPDDPIQSYLNLMSSPDWHFPDPASGGSFNGESVNKIAFEDVLELVRTAFKLEHEPGYQRPYDVAKIHKAFLAAGIYWDARLQAYVRKDGVGVTQ